MVKQSSIEAIDYEIDKLKADIPRYCLTANKAAFKKGERDIHADRVVEWAEHRLANLEAAKADVSSLAERCERLEAALRKAAGMLFHLGSNHESPEKRAMDAELADLLSGSSGGKDG